MPRKKNSSVFRVLKGRQADESSSATLGMYGTTTPLTERERTYDPPPDEEEKAEKKASSIKFIAELSAALQGRRGRRR
jgi:hypothetical protein